MIEKSKRQDARYRVCLRVSAVLSLGFFGVLPASAYFCYDITFVYDTDINMGNHHDAPGSLTTTCTGDSAGCANGWRTTLPWNPAGYQVNSSGGGCILWGDGCTGNYTPPRPTVSFVIAGSADDGSWHASGSGVRYGGWCGNGYVGPEGGRIIVHVSSNLPRSGHSHVNASVTGAANLGSNHTVELWYNGQLIGTDVLLAGRPNPYTASFNFDNANGHDGEIYALKVDGQTIAGGLVQLHNTGTIENPNWTDNINISGNVDGGGLASTPTPTPGPYNPTPMPTAVPVGTPASVTPITPPGGGPTKFGQDVVVDNPGDIYRPINDSLKTLNDSVNKIVGDGDPGEPGIQDIDLTQRGNLDDLQGQMDAISGNIRENVLNDAPNGMTGVVSNTTSGWQNASFGTVTSLNLPLSMFNSRFPTGIAVPSYAGIVREAILWVLVGCWYWIALKSVVSLRAET